jgi:hypothetical protein
MRIAAIERSPAFARVLADAERAAWAGDGSRARRLLRLAERMAPADGRADVLVAAESVRSAWSGVERQPGPTRLPAAPIEGRPRLPQLRPLQDSALLLSVPLVPEPAPPPMVRREAVSPPRRRLRGPGRRLFACWSLVMLFAVCAYGRATGARVAMEAGRPALAVRILGQVHVAEHFLLRGDARIAAGDTAGAIADYLGAARAAKPEGRAAWEAGSRLVRVPGQENAAAEALLRAYVLGISSDRWESISAALERAGRHEEAQRVRAGMGR